MSRVILIVMDSFGIGNAPDADKFKDFGSDTLGHIAEKFFETNQNLFIPNLQKMGLVKSYEENNSKKLAGFTDETESSIIASYGYAEEISTGKDTTSGHWELMGVPVDFDWHYFPPENSFPKELLENIAKRGNVEGWLGNCSASGTEIIERLGDEHIKTKKPIVYTSADSVLQICAHENYFGLERLLDLCVIAREELDKAGYNISRVIARPFIGEVGSFRRTGNRRDYAVPPHKETLLDKIKGQGQNVIAIGKISDIFAAQGITHKIKASGLEELYDKTIAELSTAPDGSLIFVNFVDFDANFGHRRNWQGYGDEIISFDKRLPEIISNLKQEDVLIITADHGNDPTWRGTDHTRERVPVLIYGKNLSPKALGKINFVDIAATIASILMVNNIKIGNNLL